MVESHCNPKPSPHLKLRVFYVRISNCVVLQSTPDHLTINHLPLTASGGPGKSTYLRRDRADRRSQEATFVSTENVAIGGSERFEVCHGNEVMVAGVMELVTKIGSGWSMKCRSMLSPDNGVWGVEKQKVLPVIEVYVAGCCCGEPVVMRKEMRVGVRRKEKKVGLEAIPQNGIIEVKRRGPLKIGLQVPDYRYYKQENVEDIDYKGIYSKEECTKEEDGELSWFKAGVRVGVGIGLGMSLGIGIGIGILFQTYQATTRNFKWRIL